MPEWNRYQKSGTIEARPYIPGEDLSEVAVNAYDLCHINASSWIGRDPNNPTDQWHIRGNYFAENYIPEGQNADLYAAIEMWQREVSGRDADIDRLTAENARLRQQVEALENALLEEGERE